MREQTTILVVDDMEINRAILAELFQSECTVLEAENGQEALDLLKARPEIDLVILDIVMPVLDGFATLKVIRGEPSWAHLPVVICTEHAEVDVQVRALDLGSTDFITKPFNARVVRHRIRNLIEMREMERKIAEQQRAHQLRDTLSSIVSPLGLFEFTENHVKALYMNQSMSDMVTSACGSTTAFSTDMLGTLYPEDAQLLVELLQGNQKNGTPVDMTYHITRQDGTVATHELHALSIRYEHFQNPIYLTSISDVTDQRRTELALRDADQRLKSLINAVPGGIITFEMSETPRITFFNDTACDIVKLTRAEFQKQAEENVYAFLFPEDVHILRDLAARFLAHPQAMGDTFRVVCKDGEIRWVRLSASPLVTVDGTLLANCVCSDVSVEKESDLKLEQAFKEMQYRSEHDALTALWNRETFNQKAQELLLKNADIPHVLLALNIQRFKVVNELFGTDMGDRVLITLSRGMERLFGDIGVCGRMEADHFMACFPSSELNMERIMHMLDSEMKAQYVDYHIEVLFGVYQVHNVHVAVDQMCDRASMALKTIKGSAVKRYAFYDENMRKNMMEEQGIIEEMNDALEQGQFIPYLQPIYNLNTLTPVSAEVLVRWKHPEKGMISPGTFIPLFERNGFITKLDYSLWEQACAILHRWKVNHMPLVPLSINISRIDLYHPQLCEDLVGLLRKYDLDPSLLKLEITESAYIDDMEVLTAVLRRLRAAGFRILMDDFGSGYSSLNTLKDMPINILKVDMRFLEELEDSPRAASILTSVVRMAKWLELPVIAEGVETKAQLDFLYSIGCDDGQGYYFSRPIPLADFETLLQNVNPENSHRRSSSVQECNLDFLWNPSMDVNLLFNTMIGGMAIFELREGALEVRRVNDAYYHVMGLTPQQVFRDSQDAFEDVFPDDREPLLEACLSALRSDRVEYVTIRRKHGDGHMIWLENKIRHLASDSEFPVFLFIVNDVTTQKEYDLTRTLSQYTQLMRNLFYNVYEVNFTTNQFSEVYHSDGSPLAPPITLEEASQRYKKLYHPDDQELFLKTYDPAYLKASFQHIAPSRALTLEHRKMSPNGSHRWASRTFIKIDGPGHEDVYLLCTSSDGDKADRQMLVSDIQKNLESIANNVLMGLCLYEYLDGQVKLLYVSDNYKRMLGYTPLEFTTFGKDPFACVFPEDQAALMDALKELCRTGLPFGLEFHVQRKNGGVGCFRTESSALYSAPGEPMLVLASNADITELKQTQEHLYSLLNEIPIGVGIIEFEGAPSLAYLNQPLAQIFGYDKEELRGKAPEELADILPFYSKDGVAEKVQDAELLQASPSTSRVYSCKRKDGKAIWVRFYYTLTHLEKGMPICCIAASEVTHYVESSRTLQWEQERSRLLSEYADLLTFDYDVPKDALTLHFHPLLGEAYTQVTENHLHALAQSTMLLDQFKPLYQKALQAACAEPLENTLEFPASFEGEPYHWCRVHFVSIADESDQVFRIVGRVLDIDREKHAEELLQVELQYRKAFLSETLYVFDYDLATKQYELLHSAPEAETRYFPYDQYTFEGKNTASFHPDDLPHIENLFSEPYLHGLYEKRHDELKFQARIKGTREEWVWTEITVHLLEASENNPPKLLFYLKVVDRQKRAEAELRKRAELDPVSTLLNRRTTQERIVQLLEENPDLSYAFFLLDIDDFKHVNDTHGHAIGDAVILTVAKALKKSFRASDLFGRLGGDEFVAFMGYSGDEGLVHVKAQKTLAILQEMAVTNHPGIRVSASLGISLAPKDGTDFETLYKNADAAMYQAKALGKNGYALLGSEPQA